jgi:hypothetical protein
MIHGKNMNSVYDDSFDAFGDTDLYDAFLNCHEECSKDFENDCDEDEDEDEDGLRWVFEN